MIRRLKNIQKRTAIVLLAIISLFGIRVLADNDDVYSGVWSSPTTLRVQFFSSSSPFYSAINASTFNWNNIDSNLKITSNFFSTPDSNKGYEIRVYGESVDAYATTLNYKKELLWYVPDWTSCTWSKSIIKLNNDSNDSQYFGALSTNLKKEYFVHELGHSLALRHPDHTVTCIMQQYNSCGSTLPLQHDKDNLKAKW